MVKNEMFGGLKSHRIVSLARSEGSHEPQCACASMTTAMTIITVIMPPAISRAHQSMGAACWVIVQLRVTITKQAFDVAGRGPKPKTKPVGAWYQMINIPLSKHRPRLQIRNPVSLRRASGPQPDDVI